MTLGSYLWSIRACTFLLFIAWCMVVLFTDPTEMGVIAYILFYSTFMLFVSGICILVLTAMWRKWLQTHDMISPAELGIALRQGFFVGVLLTSVLLMQQLHMLSWWMALIVAGAVIMVELYFVTRRVSS